VAERTEGSTVVGATPARIMAVISDYAAYPEWAGVKTAEVVAEYEDGSPAEVRMSVSQLGFDATYTLEYEYDDDDLGVSWTTIEATGAVRDIRGEYVLEPLEDGSTRVTYRLALELAMSLPGMLRRRAEKQVIETALGGLKRRVEQAAGA
jgi:ribosome-associated toxin RatA of RatAB toxin-antitoxin module